MTVTEVARELGVSLEGLRNWVRQGQADRGQGGARRTADGAEREELRRLRRQKREQAETEEIGTRRWPDRATARAEIFAFIEIFYNRWRLGIHPHWGYLNRWRSGSDTSKDTPSGRKHGVSSITGKFSRRAMSRTVSPTPTDWMGIHFSLR